MMVERHSFHCYSAGHVCLCQQPCKQYSKDFVPLRRCEAHVRCGGVRALFVKVQQCDIGAA
eukprot:12219162-Karenia_brevis.AAC.1